MKQEEDYLYNYRREYARSQTHGLVMQDILNSMYIGTGLCHC